MLGLPTQINSISLTLNANAAHGSFMTNPTSCDPAPTTLTATSGSGTVATATASFTPTACDQVPFAPTIDITPGSTQVDTPTSYAISVNVPADNSNISRVQIVTPPGTNLNAPLGDGLQPCDAAAFGKGADTAPSCPDASKVGSAQIDTPLLGVLDGDVFLATPTTDNPYGVFVAIPVPGGEIKLIGKVSPDPATGQLTSIFDGLPPVPFTRFTLTFRGGDKAVLVNDVACGTQTSQASLTPYSGTAPATPTSSFTTTADGAGGACADPLPFAPTFSAMSTNLTAGASPHVTMNIARQPGQQLLSGLELSLPAGLVGGVNGIGLCVGDDAKTGNCPAASKVGHGDDDRRRGQHAADARRQHLPDGRRPGRGRRAADGRPGARRPVRLRQRDPEVEHHRPPIRRRLRGRRAEPAADPRRHPAAAARPVALARPRRLHAQPDELRAGADRGDLHVDIRRQGRRHRAVLGHRLRQARVRADADRARGRQGLDRAQQVPRPDHARSRRRRPRPPPRRSPSRCPAR